MPSLSLHGHEQRTSNRSNKHNHVGCVRRPIRFILFGIFFCALSLNLRKRTKFDCIESVYTDDDRCI